VRVRSSRSDRLLFGDVFPLLDASAGLESGREQ
jgi:hypothetical protein